MAIVSIATIALIAPFLPSLPVKSLRYTDSMTLPSYHYFYLYRASGYIMLPVLVQQLEYWKMEIVKRQNKCQSFCISTVEYLNHGSYGDPNMYFHIKQGFTGRHLHRR